MEYTFEKISGNKVKFSFAIPEEDFEAAVQKAYLKNRGQVMIPGWRKGKAPRKVIENIYGAGVFYDDALEDIFPKVYSAAVKEKDVKVVGRPSLDNFEVKKGSPVTFNVETYVEPDVELGEYKGVEIDRLMKKVTEEEVDEKLHSEQHENARHIDVEDRPVENGDKVNLDYLGTVDGVAFEGGTAEDQELVIGSGSFIPGFEEQMIGMNIGEERDLNVTFPEKYHAEDLAGKEAVFHVKLNSITREELPALDDDFAADVSDFDTMAEYREDIRKKLQEKNDEHSEVDARNKLLDKVVDASKMDIPQPMIEEKLSELMDETRWRMRSNGVTMEMYMKMLGMDENDLRKLYRPEAERRVRVELTIAAIVKAENIEATEEELDKEIADYAAGINQNADDVRKSFGDEQLDYFRSVICSRKAYDLMWNSAKVNEVEKLEEVEEAETQADEATEPASEEND